MLQVYKSLCLKPGEEFAQGPISAFEAGQRACLTEEEEKKKNTSRIEQSPEN